MGEEEECIRIILDRDKVSDITDYEIEPIEPHLFNTGLTIEDAMNAMPILAKINTEVNK